VNAAGARGRGTRAAGSGLSKELVGLLSLDDLAARVDGCLAGDVMEEVARPDRG
jgi:hypothetical protein